MGDVTNEEISPDYQQKRREPKIGWTLNTTTTSEGIKSVNLLEPPAGLNTFRSSDLLLNPNSSLKTYFTSQNLGIFRGESNYGISEYFDSTSDNSEIAYSFSASTCVNRSSSYSVERIISRPFFTMNGGVVLSTTQHITTIQNRTFHCFDSYYVFEDSVIESGDETDSGVFEAYVTALANGRLVYEVNKIALTGITIDSSIHRGITSFGNYLMVYTKDTIFWSDPNDFTVFTVEQGSLAGSQKISEAKGLITSIVPYPQGLLIYCNENVINMQYSGDSINPWIFTEVSGALGISNNMNTTEEGAFIQYGIGAGGLQSVNSSEATVLNSPIQDLVTSGIYETKAINTSEIVKHLVATHPNFGNKNSYRVHYIELVAENLFLGITKSNGFLGAGEEYNVLDFDNTEDRFYVLNVVTGNLSVVEGSIIGSSITASSFTLLPETILLNLNTQVDNNKTPTRDSYLALLPINTNYLLDNTYQPPLGIPRRESELFIGDISINPNNNTEVSGVKLFGEFVLKDSQGIPDETTRAKVYAYSSVHGSDNPVEFKYYPSVNRYLGLIVGEDIQIEVRGVYFYLTDIEIEIQRGSMV